MARLDRSNMRAQHDRFEFVPFRPTHKNEISLAEVGLARKTELLVFERQDERRAFLAREMSYHHVGQGFLAGEPYLVTF